MGAFSTDNFSLAITLCTQGVPFLCTECPEWREISADDLEKHGYKTIEDAEEAGFEGTIVYGFADHPERAAIIKAFNKAHYGEPAAHTIPDTIEIKVAGGKKQQVRLAEIISMAFALGFKNRKKFADRRKKVRAKLKLRKGAGFSVIDRRSSPEVKERFS